MQILIEGLIRALGYVTLRVVTAGRYVGGSSGDEVREGALGLGLIALITYVVVTISK